MLNLEKQPLISVIVPVYKVEKYLHRCVDSILNQTYRNLEIILVDDGSPDNCGTICDEYAAKDSRIRVIHQENAGVSAARNAGLDACTGEYVAFVDSDDFVSDDYIKVMIDSIEDADYVMGGLLQVTETEEILEIRKPRENITETGLEALRGHYSGKNGKNDVHIIHVWGCLYKKDLWNSTRFWKDHVWEDQHIMPYIFAQCKQVKFIKYAGYHYRMNSDSITHIRSEKTAYKYYQDALAIYADHVEFYTREGLLDLAMEAEYQKVSKITAHARSKSIPAGLESKSMRILRCSTMKLVTSRIDIKRKLYCVVFAVFGTKGLELVRKLKK